MATGIGGYWVQLVEGLVMAASVILNVSSEKKAYRVLSRAARKWAAPSQRRLRVKGRRHMTVHRRVCAPSARWLSNRNKKGGCRYSGFRTSRRGLREDNCTA